jgi:hypothetical protein
MEINPTNQTTIIEKNSIDLTLNCFYKLNVQISYENKSIGPYSC